MAKSYATLHQGKEHGKKLYDSVINRPFKYGTVEVLQNPTSPQIVRDRTYEDLIEAEKIHEACDIRATNIVLQGLPSIFHSLMNHHTVAKEIWDQPEWSKFVTDVKLAKNMHNTNFDQMYAYLRQHEAHANEVHLMRQRFLDPFALIQRISLTGFLAQSVGSSNTDVLDSPCLLVLITGTSQSRQHESCKSPTTKLFEVDSGRISIRHCEY
ncbi:hypothetical protein Tco_0088210 [Tanacetum coccineum]